MRCEENPKRFMVQLIVVVVYFAFTHTYVRTSQVDGTFFFPSFHKVLLHTINEIYTTTGTPGNAFR